MRIVKQLLLLLSLSVVLFSGCRKETIASHPDFVGVWIAVDPPEVTSTLSVDSYGNARFQRKSKKNSLTVEGTFRVSSNHRYISIDAKRLRLNHYPAYYSERDRMEMELDGVLYYKD